MIMLNPVPQPPTRCVRLLSTSITSPTEAELLWQITQLYRKFTTKSDVWSFGVTLWEILNLARHRPYEGLTDLEVLENISHLHADDGEFIYLPTPQTTKDILDLMNECWKRSPTERPSFTEIHLFLQRKNLGYVPPMNS
ncbi:discoidin domain-containing receptor 2-like [Diaphorina citri]|uniref:Discoidin domain-containing receptor 2-like n=1 Tax=Diaphorina citri TaxID=121845 RepID=A0A1S3DUB8_DIACI|nr:discoidin domain-containing receptor 2-like [Diaphorina citri]